MCEPSLPCRSLRPITPMAEVRQVHPWGARKKFAGVLPESVGITSFSNLICTTDCMRKENHQRENIVEDELVVHDEEEEYDEPHPRNLRVSLAS